MNQLKLPPFYNKILFWQRLIWLLSIVIMLVSFIQVIGGYGNFASNTAAFEIGYFLIWLLEVITWGVCLGFIIHLKRAINIGKEYENQRNRNNFRSWIKASRKALVYLTLFILLFTVQVLFDQLLLGIFEL